jgi:tRNA (guanine10-N2)-dimethyltransferase
VAKLFFVLSGEHETLPTSELKAILEAEGYRYRETGKLDQTLRLEADSNCVEAIKRRAAYTRACCLELFICGEETTAITTAMNALVLKGILKEGVTFVVRIKHVKNHAANINGMMLEKKLGGIIKEKSPEAKVNLKNPDIAFIGVLTDGKLVFGVRLAEIPPKPFVERRPRKKPFFHPSAMPAKLARCMVNLTEVKAGELVFDPFCGTGSMLIEATLVGCRVLGLDIQRRMVRGSLRNLAHFNIKNEGIIVGDARTPPITRVDSVVTDPPYGRSTTTLKRTTKQIVEEVLASVHDLLVDGQMVCMAAPKTLNIENIGTALGYRHLESHFVYVHRSLTREIAVFQKV